MATWRSAVGVLALSTLVWSAAAQPSTKTPAKTGKPPAAAARARPVSPAPVQPSAGRPALAVPAATPTGVISPPQPPPAHGAVVVAATANMRRAARSLARQCYADERLRPTIDEATAQVLAGASAPARSPLELAEIADVVKALPKACAKGCSGSTVARKLLVSLGRDLDAELVVVVERSGKKPTARVLRVKEGHFASVVLTAEAPRGKPAGDLAWPDAARLIRALVLGPLSGPRRTAAGAASDVSAATNAEADDDDGFDIFSSPWFWGGVGVVVAVGITVFALSQAGVDEPGTVHLEGSVSP